MAQGGNFRPHVQLKPAITRKDGTYYARFNANVTVSLSFEEAYKAGLMTGMLTPSYPRLGDSGFIKTVAGVDQAAMYIGNGLKYICDQAFHDFKSVEGMQFGEQWIHGSNTNDLQCAARTLTGLRIPKDVLQKSLTNYGVPYISALKSYVIARPVALKPRPAFLRGKKDEGLVPKESTTEALNRL